jgi:hypothetical protein
MTVGNPFIATDNAPDFRLPADKQLHYRSTCDLTAYDPDFYNAVYTYLVLPVEEGGCDGEWDYPRALITARGQKRYGYDARNTRWRVTDAKKAYDYWRNFPSYKHAWVEVAPTAGWPYSKVIGYVGRVVEVFGVMMLVEFPDPAPASQAPRHPKMILSHASIHTVPVQDVWPRQDLGVGETSRQIEAAHRWNSGVCSRHAFRGNDGESTDTNPDDSLDDMAQLLAEMKWLRDDVAHIAERAKDREYVTDIAIGTVGQVLLELVDHLHYVSLDVGYADYGEWTAKIRNSLTALMDSNPTDAPVTQNTAPARPDRQKSGAWAGTAMPHRTGARNEAEMATRIMALVDDYAGSATAAHDAGSRPHLYDETDDELEARATLARQALEDALKEVIDGE